MKIITAVWKYLKDWKNLLSHSIVGVFNVLVAFVLPIPVVYRILILVAVIILNVVRMNITQKNRQKPLFENKEI